jgi:hypothetical protein
MARKVLLVCFAVRIGTVDSGASTWLGGGYHDNNIAKELRDIAEKIRVIPWREKYF